MSSKAAIVVVEGEIELHVACAAWRRFGGSELGATSVEILKPENRKSAVFRVNGVGPGGAAVIAKRAGAAEVELELRLYRELLPTLDIPVLELYGSLSDADDAVWLFLEDAGETWYAPGDPDHRALAVAWLAGLHTFPVSDVDWLPRTGTTYFRGQLDLAVDGVTASLTHPSVPADDLDVLSALLRCLVDTVSPRWGEVEAECAGARECLVHGDFVPKNVRVVNGFRQQRLVGFDWETSGVASPAADLALLSHAADRKAYHSLVAGSWPGVSFEDVERQWRVGRLLRLVHAVRWESRSFRHEWIHRALANMRVYQEALTEVTSELGWPR